MLVIIMLFSIAGDSADDTDTIAGGADEITNGIEGRDPNKKLNEKHGRKKNGGLAFFNNNFSEEEKLEKILRASVHLIDVHVQASDLSGNEAYQNVQGVFCTLDWATHKKNPSASAMFRELVSQSPGCQSDRFTMDLKTVVNAALKHDLEATDVKILQPKGFVFHESRCGSTLVANSLAAFAPERNRVYTESSPPVSVLVACSTSGQCNDEIQADLFRDVLYLMGRTDDLKEENLFFKFQSVTSLHIDVARLSFPDVPWMFVYRDPVQVMMSHLVPVSNAVCLKHKRRPLKETQALVQRIVHKRADHLSSEEFCAAHLASLCESALHEASASGTGRMVNYDTLPDILMDDIIPNYFLPAGSTFGEREKENIRRVSGVYSKGHGKTKEWVEDSDKKEQTATDQIRQAASIFLQSSYDAFSEL